MQDDTTVQNEYEGGVTDNIEVTAANAEVLDITPSTDVLDILPSLEVKKEKDASL